MTKYNLDSSARRKYLIDRALDKDDVSNISWFETKNFAFILLDTDWIKIQIIFMQSLITYFVQRTNITITCLLILSFRANF